MERKLILPSTPVHFVGIGGVGMAGLARLLFQQGIEVSGSDRSENRLTHELSELGVSVSLGHDRGHVPARTRWAVRTPAVQETNPEIEVLRSRHIPVFSRGDVLAAFANARKTVAVAGAHGKTTTSAMLLHILRNCGVPAGYAIGGETGFPGRVADGGDPDAPFVVEADESDGTLMQYRPEVGVITHLEWDHVERFPTQDSLCSCYGQFVEQAGRMWIRADDTLSGEVSRDHPEVRTVGREDAADLQVMDITNSPVGVRVEGHFSGQSFSCEVPLPGEHNAWNAVLAIGAATETGIDVQQAAEALKTYGGVGRRFQKKEVNGMLIIQDYAHHPTELLAVLNSVAALKPLKVWMAFQPHRYSRTQHLLNEFAEALQSADELALLPVYGAFERPEQGADSEALAEVCREKGIQVNVWKDRNALVQEWKSRVQEGDVVLIAGAGDIEELWQRW